MTRPPCDQTEDDGTPCPSWAIVGYTSCLRHWRAGDAVEGPRRLHTPPYTGVYKEGSYKLDRPVDDEPATVPAQPYSDEAAAESTEPAETVQTPDENERPHEIPATGIASIDELREELGFNLPPAEYISTRRLTSGEVAQLNTEFERTREILAGITIEPADSRTPEPLPNPPSRRGWRRLFRRAA
jgi:hypothetical protein